MDQTELLTYAGTVIALIVSVTTIVGMMTHQINRTIEVGNRLSGSIEARATRLEDKVEGLQAVTAAVDADVRALDRKVDVLAGDLAETKRDVADIKHTLAGTQRDVAEILRSIAALSRAGAARPE